MEDGRIVAVGARHADDLIEAHAGNQSRGEPVVNETVRRTENPVAATGTNSDSALPQRRPVVGARSGRTSDAVQERLSSLVHIRSVGLTCGVGKFRADRGGINGARQSEHQSKTYPALPPLQPR